MSYILKNKIWNYIVAYFINNKSTINFHDKQNKKYFTR